MKYSCTLFLLIAVAACRAPAADARALPYELLSQGSLSGEHGAGATLITSQDEWQVFWRRHSGWSIPPEAEPQVDFALHSVLVVCAGDEPSGGWSIETRSIAHEGERIRVRAALHAPAADTLQAQVLTQPYQILLVPRTSGKAELELDQGLSKR